MPAFALDSPKAIKGEELMEDKWERLEEIVERVCRRVMKEEITALQKQPKSKVGFKNGQFIGLGEIELAALAAANPAVDVKQQIKDAAAWICMNPGDAPVSNYGRFLNAWLKRTQDRASIRAIPSAPRPAEHKMKHCEYCPKVATGSVGGLWHCQEHIHDAMDRKPRAHMLGIVAKPVAGAD